jgi:hypothetical protein
MIVSWLGSRALHAEDERPARIPTTYLVFESRYCIHDELDRDMRD